MLAYFSIAKFHTFSTHLTFGWEMNDFWINE